MVDKLGSRPTLTKHEPLPEAAERPAAKSNAPVAATFTTADLDRFVAGSDASKSAPLGKEFAQVVVRFFGKDLDRLVRAELKSTVGLNHPKHHGEHIVRMLLNPDRGVDFDARALKLIEKEYGVSPQKLFDTIKDPKLRMQFAEKFGEHLDRAAQDHVISAIIYNGQTSETCLGPILMRASSDPERVRTITTDILRHGEVGLDKLLGLFEGTALEKTIVAQQFERYSKLGTASDQATVHDAFSDRSARAEWKKAGISDGDIYQFALGKNPQQVNAFIKKAEASKDPDLMHAAAQLLYIEGTMASVVSAYTGSDAASAKQYDAIAQRQTERADKLTEKAEAKLSRFITADNQRAANVKGFKHGERQAALDEASGLDRRNLRLFAKDAAATYSNWGDKNGTTPFDNLNFTQKNGVAGGMVVGEWIYEASVHARKHGDSTDVETLNTGYAFGFKAWLGKQLKEIEGLPEPARSTALREIEAYGGRDKQFRALLAQVK